jgi:hypothetical protein
MSDSTWYVCYQPRGPYRGPKECRRHSETFSTELEAKVFAKSRLADTRKITAGTINPHLPKRVIGSAQIIEWLNEENDASAARSYQPKNAPAGFPESGRTIRA